MGISRAVDHTLQDVGYAPRLGFPPLMRQVARAAGLGPEIILADDVLFSGDMVSMLAAAFARHGTRVRELVCGIAIGEGAEKLEAEGIAVTAVVSYAEVDDELCERDFAVVPGSGRRVTGSEQQALYFDNLFGRPGAWASIPSAHEASFCVQSLVRSARLLRPEARMESIGSFLGYASAGNAGAILQGIIEQRSV